MKRGQGQQGKGDRQTEQSDASPLRFENARKFPRNDHKELCVSNPNERETETGASLVS